MDERFILCFAAVMLFMSSGVKGNGHLSFANNTQVSITRAGCGVSKHCVAKPTDCDPAGNATCLFGSAVATAPVAPNGANVTIQLRGHSLGFIALGLTANDSEGTTMLFICGKTADSGQFFFRTMQRNNTSDELSPKDTPVTEIRGLVNDTLIQCEFDVPSVNATSTRNSQDASFKILLGSGNVNGSSTLGVFMTNVTSGLLNLAEPNPNATTTTATATPTTAGASSVLYSYALLLLLSVVALSSAHRA